MRACFTMPPIDPAANANSRQEVLADMGDKVLAAFSLSVDRTRADLRDYRDAFPGWVADHSERGLANWINDRLWAHLFTLGDAIPGMTLTEKGVTREVTVGATYLLRFKRHDEDGNVASYATQTFLEFAEQPIQQLPGMEEVRLIAGYEWNRDARDVGVAVLSLRDGRDNVIWKEPLPEVTDEEERGASVTTPEQFAPTAPTVVVADGVGRKAGEVGGSG